MAKFRSTKNSMSGGQISPTALGRTDLSSYASSCELLENVIPLASGGAYKRSGTQLVDTKNTNNKLIHRLIPFRVLTFFESALEVGGIGGGGGQQKGGAYIPPTVTAQMPDNYSLSISYDPVLDEVFVEAYTQGSSTPAPVDFTGVKSIAGSAVEAPPTLTDILGTDIFLSDFSSIDELQYFVVNDALILVHRSFQPIVIQRVKPATGDAVYRARSWDWGGATAGDVGTKPFRDSLPYFAADTSGIRLKFTAQSGSAIEVTSRDAADNANVSLFNDNWEGQIIKVRHGTTYGCLRLGEYHATGGGGSGSMTGCISIVELGNITASENWWQAAWSRKNGFPGTLSFYQRRLAFGGTNSHPDTVYFSQSNDVGQMSVETIADAVTGLPSSSPLLDPGVGGSPIGTDPFEATLGGNSVTDIRWMSSEESLVIGTAIEEHIVHQAAQAVEFSAEHAQSEVISHFGSARIAPARSGDALFFVTRSKKEIIALTHSPNSNRYIPEPVQVLFDDYPVGTANLRRIVWDESRKVLWSCDKSGTWAGLSYNPQLKFSAWHTHKLGGNSTNAYPALAGPASFFAGFNGGGVIDVMIQENNTSGGDDLWIASARYINATWVASIERMIGGNYPSNTVIGASIQTSPLDISMVDMAVTSGPQTPPDVTFPVSTVFNGIALTGVIRGANGLFQVPTTVVDTGTCSISGPVPPSHVTGPAWSAFFGFPFYGTIKPVRLEAGSQIGSAQAAIKRIHKATIRFYRTLHAKVGRDASNLELINFRLAATPMSNSAELFTGDKLVLLDSDYDRDGYIYITQDKSLPMTVVAIVSEGQTYD